MSLAYRPLGLRYSSSKLNRLCLCWGCGCSCSSQHGIHFSVLVNRGHALPWKPRGAARGCISPSLIVPHFICCGDTNSTGFNVGLEKDVSPSLASFRGDFFSRICWFVFQKSVVLHWSCASYNPGLALLIALTPGNPEELEQPAPTLCWALCRWQVGPK